MCLFQLRVFINISTVNTFTTISKQVLTTYINHSHCNKCLHLCVLRMEGKAKYTQEIHLSGLGDHTTISHAEAIQAKY